jgi:hypothetical protein
MYREDFLLFFSLFFSISSLSCLASKFELIYYFLLRDAMHGHPCGPLAKHPTMKCMVVPTAGVDLLTVSASACCPNYYAVGLQTSIGLSLIS